MTRKKLGLGLLETFSEACEVCAGRGVIVHHDPVVKHRAPIGNGQPPGRRPRAAAPTTNGSTGGTHVITEGVKSALAQIAASTIHSHHEEEVAPVAASVEEVVVERPKKQRKKRQDPASKSPRTEKDLLLDSVLSALPEPKAPGQGRSRRRVTTAALTGTPVAHAPSED
jgi:ribonuclease E